MSRLLCSDLSPDAKCAVPAARRQCRAVRRHLHAANLILVAVQQTDALLLQRVPNVYRVVVVAGKQQPAADREVDRVDAKYNAVLGVNGHLLVGAYVEKATLEERLATR